MLKHVQLMLADCCQIPWKLVGLCWRERCLDLNLCSHCFGRVLMMVQRCELDRLHCVSAVVAAKVEARGRWICLRGTERRVQDVSSPA